MTFELSTSMCTFLLIEVFYFIWDFNIFVLFSMQFHYSQSTCCLADQSSILITKDIFLAVVMFLLFGYPCYTYIRYSKTITSRKELTKASLCPTIWNKSSLDSRAPELESTLCFWFDCSLFFWVTFLDSVSFWSFYLTS